MKEFWNTIQLIFFRCGRLAGVFPLAAVMACFMP